MFPLSEQVRRLARDRARIARWQADLTPLRGGSIEADLALRDFTINAMAWPLTGGELIDPHGGVADLEARRLRVVGERSFADDPLRTLRMARFACELDLQVEPRRGALAAARSRGDLGSVAPERIFYELDGWSQSPTPLRGVRADGRGRARGRGCCPSWRR